MYWSSPKWKSYWHKKAQHLFADLIADYLTNFPRGCFGLQDGKKLLGALFLLKIDEIRTIPYIHEVDKNISRTGEVAYVSFFVVRKGKDQDKTSDLLYKYAEQKAKEIGCSEIAVVIYSSPIELESLKKENYKKSESNFKWEILPGKMVDAKIYTKKLS